MTKEESTILRHLRNKVAEAEARCEQARVDEIEKAKNIITARNDWDEAMKVLGIENYKVTIARRNLEEAWTEIKQNARKK